MSGTFPTTGWATQRPKTKRGGDSRHHRVSGLVQQLFRRKAVEITINYINAFGTPLWRRVRIKLSESALRRFHEQRLLADGGSLSRSKVRTQTLRAFVVEVMEEMLSKVMKAGVPA